MAIAVRLWKQGRTVSDLGNVRVANVSIESGQRLVDDEPVYVVYKKKLSHA